MVTAIHVAAVLAAAVLVNVLWRLGERFVLSRHIPRDHTDWCTDVREVLFALVDADLHKAHLQRRLATLVGREPDGYEAIAREAFARELMLVPAAAERAEDMGLFPPGTFSQLGVRHPDGSAVVGTPPPEPTPAAAPAPPPSLAPAPAALTPALAPVRHVERIIGATRVTMIE